MAITAIRTIVIYVILIIAMRIMGRRQLGELQPIELVVTLLISDLASVPMQDSGIPLFSGIVPILILVAAEILLSALMLKSPRFSTLVSGTPIILIRDGKPDQSMLKKLRITVEDLMEGLRKQNIFDLNDVQTAIAETNGTISVYPVAAKRPVVFEDLAKLPPKDHGIPLVIVADGEICDWALKALSLSEKWVDRTLSSHGIPRDNVMIMSTNGHGRVTIIPKEGDT